MNTRNMMPVLAVILGIFFTSCSKGPYLPDGSGTIRSSLNDGDTLRIAVYRGTASCDQCAETVKSALGKIGIRSLVDFVGPGESIDITDESLSRYDIYVQPGGGQDIRGAFKSLGKKRVKAIQNYVSRGGHYLGLCMGAYLADANNFGLIPDELDSEVGRAGFPVKTIDDASVEVLWMGRKDNVFFQDGPYLLPHPEDGKFSKIAVYGNGDLAAARYAYGKGLVILSGPHPEADKTWFDDAGIPVNKRTKGNLFKDLIESFYTLPK